MAACIIVLMSGHASCVQCWKSAWGVAASLPFSHPLVAFVVFHAFLYNPSTSCAVTAFAGIGGKLLTAFGAASGRGGGTGAGSFGTGAKALVASP